MAENKIFTGFKFIDEKLGGLQPDKLCCIGGDCDPIMGEQLSLSLLKGILDNNPDKSVILINCEKFPSLNCNIFAFYGENKCYSDMVAELSRRLPLKQIKTAYIENKPQLKELHQSILNACGKKSVSAILIADGSQNSEKLKLIAKELQVPIIVYDNCYYYDDYEELAARHPAADILIRCKQGENDTIAELFCTKKTSKKIHKIRTGNSGGLHMSLDLPKDKDKLWFYEDK